MTQFHSRVIEIVAIISCFHFCPTLRPPVYPPPPPNPYAFNPAYGNPPQSPQQMQYTDYNQPPPSAQQRYWQQQPPLSAKQQQQQLLMDEDERYAPRESRYVPETRIECKPQYLYSPWGIARILEMVGCS